MFAAAAQLKADIIVHTSDFIADGGRSHFNGFEAIPNDGAFYTGESGPYTEDNITVSQVNGDPGNQIAIDYLWTGTQGIRSWYPSGGDFGYTQISMSDGSDFQDVGFNFFSGFGSNSLVMYELVANGTTVLSGTAPIMTENYLGFSGGGFDTIRIRDDPSPPGEFYDGTNNAVTVDNIETAVPEPTTFTLWMLLGSLGWVVGRRRRTL
jgi:hypothetical protein